MECTRLNIFGLGDGVMSIIYKRGVVKVEMFTLCNGIIGFEICSSAEGGSHHYGFLSRGCELTFRLMKLYKNEKHN